MLYSRVFQKMFSFIMLVWWPNLCSRLPTRNSGPSLKYWTKDKQFTDPYYSYFFSSNILQYHYILCMFQCRRICRLGSFKTLWLVVRPVSLDYRLRRFYRSKVKLLLEANGDDLVRAAESSGANVFFFCCLFGFMYIHVYFLIIINVFGRCFNLLFLLGQPTNIFGKVLSCNCWCAPKPPKNTR